MHYIFYLVEHMVLLKVFMRASIFETVWTTSVAS